jgi:4-amino-4-deoxy-L-arabinose transferase-like glycosyltransferase
MKLFNLKLFFVGIVILVYGVITILSVNHGYFWDTIQQVSKEAHWFYQTNFSSLLMPVQNSGSEIVATGYHPPLMGIMTAALWKVFGYELWVSHIFIFVWALVLIFNVWKVINKLFPVNVAGWVLLIVLLEPTLLAQFSIASPDFILFTAFIISLRGVLERKPWLLSIGVFFLCGINMRGIFVGAVLFVVHCYYNYLLAPKKPNIRSVVRTALPYLPTLVLLSAYFIYYFAARGWFFSNSTDGGHYSLPSGPGRVIRHLAEFGLRSIENGRIVIWLIGIYVAFNLSKAKKILSPEFKAVSLFFLLLTGLYLLFVFTTQMPFSARYFMPQFFLLTLLALLGVNKLFSEKKLIVSLIVVLCFELTGHFWIYPDRMAKSWDCTLAHLPYYELRADCFHYIDEQKLDYKDISGGFCLYGNRRFIELSNTDKIVGTDTNRKYFIYSNISNVEDLLAKELKNATHWIPVRKFEKGFVEIIIYQNISCLKK